MTQLQCQLARHVLPVPYVPYTCGVAVDLRAALSLHLDWQSLVGQHALARFRASLLELGHRSGHRTTAQDQSCTACSAQVQSAYMHCLLECSRFSALRAPMVQALRAGHHLYLHAIALVSKIERVVRDF